MAIGICLAVDSTDTEGNPLLPSDPKAREIRFQVNPAVVTPPQDQMDLKANAERALYAVQRLFPAPKHESHFRPYFVQLLSEAQLGLAGPNASPEIARSALANTIANLIDDEGGKLKNDQLRDLAKTACWLALVPLLVYLVLCFGASKGTPLHQQLLKLTVQPEALGCFMLLWTGCFFGVVLSYGARTTTMTLADLISPSPDRLLPVARLLFAGSLTLVVGLFLAVELVEIKIGSVSSKKIMIEPMIAFLIGVACGMSQLALPASVTKKIGELLPIK